MPTSADGLDSPPGACCEHRQQQQHPSPSATAGSWRQPVMHTRIASNTPIRVCFRPCRSVRPTSGQASPFPAGIRRDIWAVRRSRARCSWSWGASFRPTWWSTSSFGNAIGQASPTSPAATWKRTRVASAPGRGLAGVPPPESGRCLPLDAGGWRHPPLVGGELATDASARPVRRVLAPRRRARPAEDLAVAIPRTPRSVSHGPIGWGVQRREVAMLEVLQPHLAAMQAAANQVTAVDPDVSITRREAQVLSCVAAGQQNAEIAELLSVTPATVRKHLEHAYAKLGVHGRGEAVAALMRLQGEDEKAGTRRAEISCRRRGWPSPRTACRSGRSGSSRSP